MWSAVGAERLGIIGHRELADRLRTTLTTLEGMERHEPSGQFYNWYDRTTGEKLTVWPPTGEPLTPILSSVDNGWLATGLRIVASSVPEVADRARAIYDGMDFGFYYRPEVNRILFHYVPDTGAEACCYDTVVSESRIASYIGIANGQLPRQRVLRYLAQLPRHLRLELAGDPAGRPLADLPRGLRLRGRLPVRGDARHALLGREHVRGPDAGAVRPRGALGRAQLGRQPPAHGRRADPPRARGGRLRLLGLLARERPRGRLPRLGRGRDRHGPERGPSNEDGTLIDHGFAGCPDREPQPDPPQSAYTNGVVTPHAAFLALRYAPAATLADLGKLADDFPGLYTDWGFRDSVNVQTGAVSDSYLALDQGMIMAAIANELGDDVLRRAFVGPDVERAIRPLIAIERFGAKP